MGIIRRKALRFSALQILSMFRYFWFATLGSIGAISEERLENVRQRLAKWVASES